MAILIPVMFRREPGFEELTQAIEDFLKEGQILRGLVNAPRKGSQEGKG